MAHATLLLVLRIGIFVNVRVIKVEISLLDKHSLIFFWGGIRVVSIRIHLIILQLFLDLPIVLFLTGFHLIHLIIFHLFLDLSVVIFLTCFHPDTSYYPPSISRSSSSL